VQEACSTIPLQVTENKAISCLSRSRLEFGIRGALGKRVRADLTAVADQKLQAKENEMSVQKKSLISQRAAVTKAIVATPDSEKKAKAKLSPQVMPKAAPKVTVAIKGRLSKLANI
jgi:hypothetical protein